MASQRAVINLLGVKTCADFQYETESPYQPEVMISGNHTMKVGDYFEVEILCRGDNGYISIGLVPPFYPKHRLPGWNEGSIAYHGDDGGLFQGCASKSKTISKPVKQGERMGCGVQNKGGVATVYFTKNGNEIYSEAFRETYVYPAVGMGSRGEMIRLVDNGVWKFPLPDNTDPTEKLHQVEREKEALEQMLTRVQEESLQKETTSSKKLLKVQEERKKLHEKVEDHQMESSRRLLEALNVKSCLAEKLACVQEELGQTTKSYNDIQEERKKFEFEQEAMVKRNDEKYQNDIQKLKEEIADLQETINAGQASSTGLQSHIDVSSALAEEYRYLMNAPWQEARTSLLAAPRHLSESNQLKILSDVVLECWNVADAAVNSYLMKQLSLIMDPLASSLKSEDTTQTLLESEAANPSLGQALDEEGDRSLGDIADLSSSSSKKDQDEGEDEETERCIEDAQGRLHYILQLQSRNVDVSSLVQEVQKKLLEKGGALTKEILANHAIQTFLVSCCKLVWKMVIHKPPLQLVCPGLSKRMNKETQELYAGCRDSLTHTVDFYVRPQLNMGEGNVLVKGVVYLSKFKA